ncbi:transketolase C-terminal domain-containing protein [Streptomyces sp. NPDC002730]|uniref:transketolase C-terminal domain-containing protein n=1 Tax=Streptomyces sp. NPDC002730 TaxID=3364662 RepID=UPI00369CBC86
MRHDHDGDGEHTSSRRAFIRTSSAGVTAAGLLADAGIGVTVDPRWAAPVNPALAHLAARHRLAPVVEDSIADGGIGTLIAHDCIRAGITTPERLLEEALRLTAQTGTGPA